MVASLHCNRQHRQKKRLHLNLRQARHTGSKIYLGYMNVTSVTYHCVRSNTIEAVAALADATSGWLMTSSLPLV